MKAKFTVAAAVILGATVASAQVRPPGRESLIHHLLAPHRDKDELPQRFNDLKCALVLIQSGPRLGTGFFVSPDGDVATASHVLGDRKFTLAPNGQITVSFTTPPVVQLTDSSGKKHDISIRTALEFNPDAWLSDVARIKTGIQTSCWLGSGDDRKARVGEHLIVLGFPGLSFQALTVYTGIMSARLTSVLPTIVLDSGQAVQAPNDFIRVQMPISPGLSGAPLIDDENHAIGVITTAGGWTADLENLTAIFRTGALNIPPAAATNPPAAVPNGAPQPTTISISLPAVTAELAGLFHDYASPG